MLFKNIFRQLCNLTISVFLVEFSCIVARQLNEKDAANNPRLLKSKSIWNQLARAIYNKETNRFDTSKFPDIFDCAKYDAIHNPDFDIDFKSLFYDVKPLSNWIAPQEYGITKDSKLAISREVCSPIMKKLVSDLTQMAEFRQQVTTTTRFYFTSESHIHSLLTLIQIAFDLPVTSTRDVNYISHIIVRMFENMNISKDDPKRFEVDVFFYFLFLHSV